MRLYLRIVEYSLFILEYNGISELCAVVEYLPYLALLCCREILGVGSRIGEIPFFVKLLLALKAAERAWKEVQDVDGAEP